MLKSIKLTGNITREYLSITLTSLILGIDARNTPAPLVNARKTFNK